MAIDHQSSNIKRKLANRVILLAVIAAILVIPTYAGIIAAIVMWYGEAYITMLFYPDLAFQSYKPLFDYWWAVYQYWSQYGGAFPEEYTLKFFAPPAGGAFFSLFLLFLIRAPLLDFRPFKLKESVHGDAHWASEAEIRRARLRCRKGLLLGRTGVNNYLICDDFQHVLLFAPTGSGKGVGFVIPNLLFWTESVVCHDIKMENHGLTSGYRARIGQDVFLWNPADPEGISHCYNPLDWISEKPGQMVDDVQKICNLILPEQEFWQNEARSLMLGVILYLIAVPEKVNSFGEVVRTMRSDDVVYNLAVVLDTIGKRIHPVAYMNIAAFLQKADKERSGVISTLNSGLELWANPLIDATTARSDFDLQMLKKKKMSVYCGVTPDNLKRLEPLLKVFYQQCTDFLTRHLPKKDEPYGVLLMMDEFPSLGEMPQFQIGIAYFRGYRVKLFLITQDTQQLKGIYEEAGMNSFLSNSYYRITFAANNVETANLISQLIGNKTAQQFSHNKPKFMDLNPAARTVAHACLNRAICSKKSFYFKDKFFVKRVLPRLPIPQQEPYDPRKKKAEAEAKAAAKPPEPPKKEEASA
mgnify:CR=1 FL=1